MFNTMKLLYKEVEKMFELVPWRRNRGALARPRSELLNWFFEDLTLPDFWSAEREWLPAFDVSETENEIMVKYSYASGP